MDVVGPDGFVWVVAAALGLFLALGLVRMRRRPVRR
jgi:hypothetical protein